MEGPGKYQFVGALDRKCHKTASIGPGRAIAAGETGACSSIAKVYRPPFRLPFATDIGPPMGTTERLKRGGVRRHRVRPTRRENCLPKPSGETRSSELSPCCVNRKCYRRAVIASDETVTEALLVLVSAKVQRPSRLCFIRARRTTGLSPWYWQAKASCCGKFRTGLVFW